MLYSLSEETEGKLQMRLSLRNKGLDSLFKEVRVFKVLKSTHEAPTLVLYAWTKFWAALVVSYLWPTRTELSRRVSENLKFLDRNISVICPGSCRVTEILDHLMSFKEKRFQASHFCDL